MSIMPKLASLSSTSVTVKLAPSIVTYPFSIIYGSWLESVSLKLYRMESPSGFLEMMVAVVSTWPWLSACYTADS